MAIYYVTPTGSDTAAGTSASPWSLKRAFGQVAGQSKPGGTDTVNIGTGFYAPGALGFSVSGSGGKVTFKKHDGAVWIDTGYGAQNGVDLRASPMTGWALVPSNGLGNGIIDYGGGQNSGSSFPYLYYRDSLPRMRLFVDDYVFGEGDLDTPGSTNYWWVAPGDYATYDAYGANPNKRPHAKGTDGHTDDFVFGTRTSDMHDWRGQMFYGSLPGGPANRLYLRCHTSGDMTGATPAHSVFGTQMTGASFTASGQSNVIFDGIGFRHAKRFWRLANCQGFEFRNCTFKWSWRDALDIDGGGGHKIIGNTIYGGSSFEHADGFGNIFVYQCADVLIEGNDIAGGHHQAIWLRDAVRPIVRVNYIHHTPYAFQFQGSTRDGLIEHNYFEHIGRLRETLAHPARHGCIHLGGDGGSIQQGTATFTTGFVIRRNRAYKCGYFLDRRGNGFRDCTIHNNTDWASEYPGYWLEDFYADQSGGTRDNLFQNNLSEAGDEAGGVSNAPRRTYFLNMFNWASNSGFGNRIRNCCSKPDPAETDPIFVNSLGDGGGGSFTTNEAQTTAPAWVQAVFDGGSVEGDPNLVAPDNDDVTLRDYALNAGSIAENAGSATGLPGTVLGYPDTPSPSDDMGAYEGSDGGAGGAVWSGLGGGGGGGPSNQQPTLNLTANTTTPTAGDTVEFQANATDEDEANLDYAWVFGNPNDAVGNTVSGTGKATYDVQSYTGFDHPGTYVVTVTVTDSGGLTAQDSITINVQVARGGVQITDFSGATLTSFGTGGADVDNSGDGSSPSTADKLVDGLWSTLTQMASRNGLQANPQGWRIDMGAAQSNPLTRARWRPYKAEQGRAYTYKLRTAGNDLIFANVHTAATFINLTGNGNDWSEIDFAAIANWRAVELEGQSASDNTDFFTAGELQLFWDDSGTGSPPGIQVPFLRAWSPDGNVGIHTPDRAIDGIKPNRFRPLSRWQYHPIDDQPAWYGELDNTGPHLHIDVYWEWARAGIVYTYTIATADTEAGTYTDRFTDVTNSTTTDVTRHTLGMAQSFKFLRITVTSKNVGRVVALNEVEVFAE